MAEKKILDEEILSDDELDQVVGGTVSETSSDSYFLNIYGLCDKHSEFTLICDALFGASKWDDIRVAWAKVGIKLKYGEYGEFEDNNYYLNDKKISRGEAILHVINTLGDPMKTMIKNSGY